MTEYQAVIGGSLAFIAIFAFCITAALCAIAGKLSEICINLYRIANPFKSNKTDVREHISSIRWHFADIQSGEGLMLCDAMEKQLADKEDE